MKEAVDFWSNLSNVKIPKSVCFRYSPACVATPLRRILENQGQQRK